jgi:hypothetical protein
LRAAGRGCARQRAAGTVSQVPGVDLCAVEEALARSERPLGAALQAAFAACGGVPAELVAARPDLCADAARLCAQSASVKVRLLLWENQACPPELLADACRSAADAMDEDEAVLLAARCQDLAALKVLGVEMGASMWVRVALAGNPAVPDTAAGQLLARQLRRPPVSGAHRSQVLAVLRARPGLWEPAQGVHSDWRWPLAGVVAASAGDGEPTGVRLWPRLAAEAVAEVEAIAVSPAAGRVIPDDLGALLVLAARLEVTPAGLSAQIASGVRRADPLKLSRYAGELRLLYPLPVDADGLAAQVAESDDPLWLASLASDPDLPDAAAAAVIANPATPTVAAFEALRKAFRHAELRGLALRPFDEELAVMVGSSAPGLVGRCPDPGRLAAQVLARVDPDISGDLGRWHCLLGLLDDDSFDTLPWQLAARCVGVDERLDAAIQATLAPYVGAGLRPLAVAVCEPFTGTLGELGELLATLSAPTQPRHVVDS